MCFDTTLSDDEFMAELNTQIMLAATNSKIPCDNKQKNKDDSLDFETLTSLDGDQKSDLRNDTTDSCFSIIDVTGSKELFDVFVNEWKSQSNFTLSIACESTMQSNKGIGGNIGQRSTHVQSGLSSPSSIIYDDHYAIVGIAICWGGLDSYYINLKDCDVLQEDTTNVIECSLMTPNSDPVLLRQQRIESIMNILADSSSSTIKTAYNLKEQYKVLMRHLKIEIKGISYDPKIGIWLLDQDAHEKTFHAVMTNYLADEVILLDSVTGSCADGNGIGLHYNSQISGRRRACIESVLVHKLQSIIEAMLRERELFKLYTEIEMPVIRTLCWLELEGIEFCMEECQQQIERLQSKLTCIEGMAYKIAGRPFQLTSPTDIAHVLYTELRLSADENKDFNNNCSKGKRALPKRSTCKDVLQKLSRKHPLPMLVLEWRRINSALTKTLYPLKRYSKYCHKSETYRVYPSCQMHTATGRISISDPNLQNIPKSFDVAVICPDNSKSTVESLSASMQMREQMVCMRNIIGCSKDTLLLSADYSQLELRLIGKPRISNLINVIAANCYME